MNVVHPSDDEKKHSQTSCLCFPFLCMRDCCIPTTCATLLCFIPSIHRHNRQKAEAFCLQYPKTCACCLGTNCCYFLDVLHDCNKDGRFFHKYRRQLYGTKSYCTQQKVNVSDFEQCKEILLTGGLHRGPYLGLTNFVESRLGTDEKGRPVSILTMSCPGDKSGDRDAFRKAFEETFITEEGLSRIHPSNPTMQKYMNALVQDLNHPDKDFLNKHMPMYFAKALHWALLEIDISAEEGLEDLVWRTYLINTSAAMHHMWYLNLLSTDERTQNAMYEECRKQYIEKSPVLKRYQENSPAYNNMSLYGLLVLLQKVLTIAALQGPQTGLLSFLTNRNSTFDGFSSLPIDDREQWRLVLLEHMRIDPPVFGTTVISDKPTTCPVGGYDTPVVFPTGTPLHVNFILTGLDEAVFPNPEKFDPVGRSNLLWGPDAKITYFNGVGDNGPRVCPGRVYAIELMITAAILIIAELKKQNRGFLHR